MQSYTLIDPDPSNPGFEIIEVASVQYSIGFAEQYVTPEEKDARLQVAANEIGFNRGLS